MGNKIASRLLWLSSRRAGCSASVFGWNAIVPPWLEILLDVLGFAGFVGLAIWHKAPRKDDETLQR
jgi:hypothetical protein